jgi:hypothetical protein
MRRIVLSIAILLSTTVIAEAQRWRAAAARDR